MSLTSLQKETKKLGNKKRAILLSRYFKTGEGEYGFGDVFLGLTVPKCREIAIKYKDLSFEDLLRLLHAEFHEERLIALLILVYQFEHDEMLQRRIYEFYLKNTKFINNWDLVDLSAHKIVGEYLIDKPRKPLYELAKSKLTWERRISIISTFAFIKKGELDDSLAIAEILIGDENDLIQKALGWMLREVGKKDPKTLDAFLKKHYQVMGRTALRYSIEKLPEKNRQAFLKGLI